MILRTSCRVFRAATLVLALITLSACSGESGSESSSVKALVIFCQANNAEPYRAAQNQRFEELLGARDDIELIIYDGQADASNQISQIEQAINQQPDVLIVAPFNRTAMNAPMKQAMEAGIPTICLERDITGKHHTTFVSSDNVAIGRLAGEYIVARLTERYGEPKGRLVEITGAIGVQAANDRHAGAFEVLQPYIDAGQIEVAHTATGNWFKSEAMARMEEAFVSTEGEFDVVYAHNDPMAYGAYLVVKEKEPELAEEAIFIGIDGLPDEGVLYVQNGELDATFEYPLCVDKATELVFAMIDDPSFEPNPLYILPSRTITAETLAAGR